MTENEEFEFRHRLEQEQAQQPQDQAQPDTSPDFASTLYHGAIEGGAMTLGGAAGAVLGAPAGPVGSALGAVGLGAAMYPPAKRFAEGIDRLRGITPPPQPGIGTEFGQGLAVEATMAALKPVMSVGGKVLGKVLPGAKAGEMVSGTPALNLKRAYKQGFSETYLKPKSLAEAGESFGAEKFKMIGETLTPEEQVAMMVNPRGEANNKVADVMTKWLKGNEVSAEEALAARQGIDTIFPADTARKQVQRGGMSQFREAMNKIIGEKNPAFKSANDDYAKSKLRSQLSKPFRVNKNNPDQYSKLGGMFSLAVGAGGVASGAVLPAVGFALGTSPLAMGLTSSLAGSASRAFSGTASDVARRAVITQFVDRFIHPQGNQ